MNYWPHIEFTSDSCNFPIDNATISVSTEELRICSTAGERSTSTEETNMDLAFQWLVAFWVAEEGEFAGVAALPMHHGSRVRAVHTTEGGKMLVLAEFSILAGLPELSKYVRDVKEYLRRRRMLPDADYNRKTLLNCWGWNCLCN